MATYSHNRNPDTALGGTPSLRARPTFIGWDDENNTDGVPTACTWDRTTCRDRLVACSEEMCRKLCSRSPCAWNAHQSKGQPGVISSLHNHWQKKKQNFTVFHFFCLKRSSYFWRQTTIRKGYIARPPHLQHIPSYITTEHLKISVQSP